MPKALQIGNDPLLMQTRTGLLAVAGLEVINLSGLRAVLNHASPARWDVAILCHTLSRTDRAAIVAILRRRNPRAPVLLIARRNYTPAAEAAGFDATLSPVPAKMIAALREIVTSQTQSQNAASLEGAAD